MMFRLSMNKLDLSVHLTRKSKGVILYEHISYKPHILEAHLYKNLFVLLFGFTSNINVIFCLQVINSHSILKARSEF